MSDSRRQILEMLEAGMITKEDAERLLEALGDEPEVAPAEQNPMLDSAREMLESAKDFGKESVKYAKEAASNAKESVKDLVPHLTLHPENEPVDLDKILGEVPGADAVQGAMKGILGAAKEAISSAKQAVSKLSQIDTKLTAQGSQSFPCEGLSEINVQWASCEVFVQRWDGDTVRVTEFANRPLDPDECMVVRDDDGSLTILWNELNNTNGFLNPLQKRLMIELPAECEQLDTLEVHTGSAEIHINVPGTEVDTVELGAGSGNVVVYGMTADDFHVETGSGKISVNDTSADSIELDTGSGRIELSQAQCEDLTANTGSGSITAEHLHAETIEMESGSGSITVNGVSETGDLHLHSSSGNVKLATTELPRCAELHSVSGSVTVLLPQEPLGGFTVEYNTVSGSFQCDFPLEGEDLDKHDGSGTYGDGECELSLSSTSGSMKVKRS